MSVYLIGGVYNCFDFYNWFIEIENFCYFDSNVIEFVKI